MMLNSTHVVVAPVTVVVTGFDTVRVTGRVVVEVTSTSEVTETVTIADIIVDAVCVLVYKEFSTSLIDRSD